MLWKDMQYLWIASAVVWFVTLFYIVSLLRRQLRLQKELDTVEQSIEEIRKAHSS